MEGAAIAHVCYLCKIPFLVIRAISDSFIRNLTLISIYMSYHKRYIDNCQYEKRGVLSLLGDDGYPYGIPMDHWYSETDGKLYFHCAREGHKLDAIRACDKVSYCVLDDGSPIDGDWAIRFNSVIVFGRIEIVDDRETVYDISRKLCHKFTQDEAYIEKEITHAGPRTLMFRLMPEHMTGKLVNEA